jgi:hypothetical protein
MNEQCTFKFWWSNLEEDEDAEMMLSLPICRRPVIDREFVTI